MKYDKSECKLTRSILAQMLKKKCKPSTNQDYPKKQWMFIIVLEVQEQSIFDITQQIISED